MTIERFTASQIATAAGITKPAVLQKLKGITGEPTTVRGQEANAWSIAELPADLRAILEKRREVLGYPDIDQLLRRGPRKWKPPVKIGQVSPADLAEARMRRDVLAPILREYGERLSLAELVQMAKVRFTVIEQGQAPSDSTVRRYIELARRRDRGEGDWDRVEIYLLDKAFRKLGAKSPEDTAVELKELAAVIETLPIEGDLSNAERAFTVWKAALQELAWAQNKGGSGKEAKRKIVDFLHALCPWLADNRDALRRTLDRKWKAWTDAGGDPEAIKDGRKSGVVGRGAMAKMTSDQVATVQSMAVRIDPYDPQKTKRVPVSLALRLYAQSDECPEDLREVILKKRASKHTITPTLKRQVQVTQASRLLHKGQKAFELHGLYQPRGLFWVDAEGRQLPILPGNLFEADDMHFNEPFYVPWEDGRDKCVSKFGVRLFRAQLLAWLDVGSGRFVAYSIVLRPNDAYRAKDIKWSVCNLFGSVGIPAMADGTTGFLRFERGVWDAKIINALERSHGLVNIQRAKNAKGKFIENRFNQLQKFFSLMGCSVGRRRGEMERESKKWTACREGRMDPRKAGFLSLEELTRKVDAAFVALNGEPMEGENYGRENAQKLHGRREWIPDEIWSLSPKELRHPKADEIFRIMPENREVSIRKGWAKCRVAEHKATFYFHHESFARLGDGYKVIVCFDPARPDLGGAILSNEDAARAAECDDGSRYGHADLICIAEMVDRAPQFDATSSWDDGESIARTKRYRQQCRLLYREIMPFGRGRGASAAESRNDRGDVATVRGGDFRTPVLPAAEVEEAGDVVRTNRRKRAGELLEKSAGGRDETGGRDWCWMDLVDLDEPAKREETTGRETKTWLDDLDPVLLTPEEEEEHRILDAKRKAEWEAEKKAEQEAWKARKAAKAEAEASRKPETWRDLLKT